MQRKQKHAHQYYRLLNNNVIAVLSQLLIILLMYLGVIIDETLSFSSFDEVTNTNICV